MVFAEIVDRDVGAGVVEANHVVDTLRGLTNSVVMRPELLVTATFVVIALSVTAATLDGEVIGLITSSAK